VGLLQHSGIEMAIPSTRKFILVNIPSYELLALLCLPSIAHA